MLFKIVLFMQQATTDDGGVAIAQTDRVNSLIQTTLFFGTLCLPEIKERELYRLRSRAEPGGAYTKETYGRVVPAFFKKPACSLIEELRGILGC